MNLKNVLKVIAFLTILLVFKLEAQTPIQFWTELSKEKALQTEQHFRKINLVKERFFQLNLARLKDVLSNLDHREEDQHIVLTFPNSEGKLSRYRVFKAPVMMPDLQSLYPNMKSYKGQGIDSPTETLRFSVTPKGLHAMFLGTENGTQFIDPFSIQGDVYTVYSKKNMAARDFEFECEVIDDPLLDRPKNFMPLSRNADDGILRDYRIAIACTGEYAQFHGGTVDGAMAAMVVTMTRVNGVYERDLSIRMTMVPNLDIIFTDGATDPFNNDNTASLISQSQTQISNIIGPENFDIGHTFSTGAGGLAALGVTCSDSQKASGVTGITQPVGDAFDIDFVAHELGHQFGSPHTFNGNQGNCQGFNRSELSAYEPGSGSTIMAYAGICGSDNIQNNSDDYFHQRSIELIWAHVQSTGDCPENRTDTNNTEPTAEAGANFIIPRGTPYRLDGSSSSDPDDTQLTYTWEQFDLGPSGIPSSFLAEGPLVRSFPPSLSPLRYIPRLEDYLDTFGQSTTWEVISNTSRDINFRLTVRDNDIRGGQTDSDEMTVTVTNSAGPFRVTSQNGININYEGLSTQTVVWQVNGTDSGAIGAENVNILLSTDGGLTYDITVLANTPNDGTQEVQIPNVDADNCRFMVEAVDNIFYNINFRDFSISQNLNVEEQSLNSVLVYPSPNSGEFTISFNPKFGEDIKVEVYDIRGRAIYQKSYQYVGRFEEIITLNKAQSGVYLLNISQGAQKVTKRLIVD